MEQTPFYTAINKEITYYGLVRLGIIFGGVGVFITCCVFGLMICLAGAIPGYILGAYLSKHLHSGNLMRWCYWHLPSFLFKRYKLPDSCYRYFL